MRQVHCDGCGFPEDENIPKANRTINQVTLMVVEDPRFPEGSTKFEADLCPDCLGMVKHNYFKVPAKGMLDLPAFAERVDPTTPKDLWSKNVVSRRTAPRERTVIPRRS